MKVGMVAGETSGDLLGAGLIEAFRKRHPDAVFEGIAGPAMIAAGCQAIADADELAVMGLIEPLRHIPRLLRLRRSLIERWLRNPPDVFIGIDAPDFNLGLETALRDGGVRTVHYVSPTIWAWRPGRIHKIARAADCVLCILPFEPDLYRDAGVTARFVGHPKADELSGEEDATDARAALGIDAEGPLIALMPGSRSSEVSRLAALFADVAARIADARPDVKFVVPVAVGKLRSPIEKALREANVIDRCTLLDGDSIRAMTASDLVIQASGTAVLEAALLGRPAIAVYKLAPLSGFIVRTLNLIKLDYVTLPNNLTPTPMIPEFLQERARAELIADEALDLLDNDARRAAIVAAFAKLRRELALGASERAAEAVSETIGDTAAKPADTDR
jgi:lipid-A-disaccharide synthase